MAGTLTVLLAGEVKKKKELRYSRESIQDTGLGLEQISLAMKTFLNGGDAGLLPAPPLEWGYLGALSAPIPPSVTLR